MSITVQQIAKAGVVGAGGAGFPTHVKLSAEADTVIINAAECEPLLHKDKEMALHFADQMLAGLAEAMRLVKADRGIVGIKGKYTRVIEQVKPKLASNMEIVPLSDSYPSGDEFILVYDAVGRVVPPGQIPLAVGVVVMNVETAFNVALADQTPVTEKYLSVAGAVPEPVTVCAPVGAPLSACIEAAGGASIADPNYVIGGAMMGYLEPDLQAPVTKTMGGILVLPDDNFVVLRKKWNWRQTRRVGMGSCDQCGYCTELCPRYLIGHPIEPHLAMRSLGFNQLGHHIIAGTQFCCECNLCSYYSCPEDLDPKNVCTHNKNMLMESKKRWENPPFREDRAEKILNNRKAPIKRLMQRLGLTRYRNVGPLIKEPLSVETVRIPLKQHIGAPCEPTVSVGEEVQKGMVVGKRPEVDGKTALGTEIHASIDGKVTAIEEETICIVQS